MSKPAPAVISTLRLPPLASTSTICGPDPETVSGSGPQLVSVDATGGARRVLLTAGAGFDISFPHWLK